MANNAYLFCMTRLCDTPVAYGHAMPCAPAFPLLNEAKFGGVVVSAAFRIRGWSVPVPGGGPPTHKE